MSESIQHVHGLNAKQFHIGDLISVATERLVSPSGIGGVYDILNFMTGADLFTHQLPRANDVCAPALLKQHPWLADIDASPVNPDNWEQWLSEQGAEYGSHHLVSPLPEGAYGRMDPILELTHHLKIPKERILPVVIPNTGDDS